MANECAGRHVPGFGIDGDWTIEGRRESLHHSVVCCGDEGLCPTRARDDVVLAVDRAVEDALVRGDLLKSVGIVFGERRPLGVGREDAVAAGKAPKARDVGGVGDDAVTLHDRPDFGLFPMQDGAKMVDMSPRFLCREA